MFFLSQVDCDGRILMNYFLSDCKALFEIKLFVAGGMFEKL